MLYIRRLAGNRLAPRVRWTVRLPIKFSETQKPRQLNPLAGIGQVYHHMTLWTRFCYLDRLGPEGPVHWLGNVKTVPG